METLWERFQVAETKLSEVFESLLPEIQKFDRPWSVAELCLSKEDIQWLKAWFANLDRHFGWEWTEYSPSGIQFCTLLMVLGAEVCRDLSNEGQVWPCVLATLPEGHSTRSKLFLSNGQPSEMAKSFIREAATRLNMRNAMDIEGSLKWFVTIKLQFGFTFRGAKNRLAEWLAGFNPPHAVQYLNGDVSTPGHELRSPEFVSLWQVLKHYRREEIQDYQARQVLDDSPWIRSEWTDELLKQARSRIDLGYGEGVGTLERSATSVEETDSEPFISRVRLLWPGNAKPRLEFELKRDIIAHDLAQKTIPEIRLFVDGKGIAQWTKQRNGNWVGEDRIFAESEKSRTRPNLMPCRLEIRSSEDEVLYEFEFSDLGLHEDILLYDQDSEEMMVGGRAVLNPSHNHILVCPKECEIEGCDILETYSSPTVNRKVLRLQYPLQESFRISFKSFVLWQPVEDTDSTPKPPSPILRTLDEQVISLGDKTNLLVSGIPDSVDCVQLLVGTQLRSLNRQGDEWVTEETISMTPELASHSERVYVKFTCESKSWTMRPRLDFSVLGAAILEESFDNSKAPRLRPLKRGDVIRHTRGSLQIWVPDPTNTHTVFEHACHIGLLRNGRIRLRDFLGYGGEISVRGSAGSNPLGIRVENMGDVTGFVRSENHHSLGVRIENFGDLERYRTDLLRVPTVLTLAMEKTPSRDYQVVVWRKDAKGKDNTFLQVLANSVQTTECSDKWEISVPEGALAVALAFKGHWLGAYSNIEKLKKVHLKTAGDFAAMRWMRLPIFNPAIEPAIRNAVESSGNAFIRAWFGNQGLPESLQFRDDKPDTVFRHFFWLDIAENNAATVSDICLGQHSGLIERICWAKDVSLALLFRLLQSCKKKEPKERFLQILYEALCFASETQEDRLLRLKERLERAIETSVGLNARRLGLLFERWRNSQRTLAQDDRWDLSILGELPSGRQYALLKLMEFVWKS